MEDVKIPTADLERGLNLPSLYARGRKDCEDSSRTVPASNYSGTVTLQKLELLESKVPPLSTTSQITTLLAMRSSMTNGEQNKVEKLLCTPKRAEGVIILLSC